MESKDNRKLFFEDLLSFLDSVRLHTVSIKEGLAMAFIVFALSAFELVAPGWLMFVGLCSLITFGSWRAYRDERRLRVVALESISHQPLVPDLKLNLRFSQVVGYGMMGDEIGKQWAESHSFRVTATNLGSTVSVSEVLVSCDGHHNRRAFLSSHTRSVLPCALETHKTIEFQYTLPPGKFVEFVDLQPLLQVRTTCGKEYTLGVEEFKAMRTEDGQLWSNIIIHQTRGEMLREIRGQQPQDTKN